ncbi:MAG: hypothetical protein ACP5MC_00890 [Candidatus Micrarchaeia archaeon]
MNASMLKLVAIAFLLVASTNAASSTTGISLAHYSIFTSWLPVVFTAIMVAILLTAIMYVFGFLLNNRSVKSRAKSEFAQAVGTGIVVVIIIYIFSIIGQTLLTPASIVSPKTTSQICNSLTNSHLDFIKNSKTDAISSTAFICNDIIESNTQSMTRSLDYGLAATYLIIANVTNQAVNNLNAFYVYDGIVSFLRSVTSTTGISIGEGGTAGTGKNTAPSASVSFIFAYNPLAGYSFLVKMIIADGIVSALVIYSFTLQMILILFLLVSWPYVLATGIILRTFAYTRKLGGLLIGAVIALLVIYPVITTFEYASLSSQNSYPIGTNTMPYLPIYELAPDGNVMVYGAVSGYEPISSGVYVYEAQCGNSLTETGQPISSPPQWQICQNCYIEDNSLCPNTQQPYAYETVCGDPNTAEQSDGTYACTGSPIPWETSTGTPNPRTCIEPFILPNATETLKYYNCWTTNMPEFEFSFDAFYLIPFFGIGTGVINLIGGIGSAIGAWPTSLPALPPTLGCTPNNAIDAGLALTNIYGVTSITAFILPLLNILIVYSGAIGLSYLLGGDTDIIGLSKLL